MRSHSVTQWDWSGVEVSFQFHGTGLDMEFDAGGVPGAYNIFLDGNQFGILNVTHPSRAIYGVVSGLPLGVHSARFTKRTEAFFGTQNFVSLRLHGSTELPLEIQQSQQQTHKLEIIGDSITCGYGVHGTDPDCPFTAGTEDNLVTWGPQIARAFDAEYNLVCWSGKGIVRNYGDKNITSPDPFPIYYNRTLATEPDSLWKFSQFTPDAVLINLGTNDCSTPPIPPEAVFIKGFLDFISVIRSHYRNVPVFLACGPLLQQDPCCNYVQAVTSQLPGVTYLPMVSILEWPTDYGCSGHPNVLGQTKMAKVAIPIISKVMNWQ